MEELNWEQIKSKYFNTDIKVELFWDIIEGPNYENGKESFNLNKQFGMSDEEIDYIFKYLDI